MKYLGLLNIVFMVIAIALLIKKRGNFDFSKLTYSHLGAENNIGLWFNLSLIIFAVNQVLFSLQVSKSEVANILFILGGVV